MEEDGLYQGQRELYDMLHGASTEFPYDSVLAILHNEARKNLPAPIIKEHHEEVELEERVA
jgi:hypothetical protein